MAHHGTWGYEPTIMETHGDIMRIEAIYIYIDMWVDIIGIYKIYIYI